MIAVYADASALAGLNHARAFLSAHPAARGHARDFRLRLLPARLA